PLLEEPSGNAEFRSHWLALPLEANLRDHAPDAPPVTIEVRTGDQPILIRTVDGKVAVGPGTASGPDATLSGTPSLIVGLLAGAIDLAAARAGGLQFEGDEDALRRVQPVALPRARAAARRA